MGKEKKKNGAGKILSEFKIRVKLLEFLAFVDSVKRFEQTNGRRPTQTERKNISTVRLRLFKISRSVLKTID
jgi:hypothetical protein